MNKKQFIQLNGGTEVNLDVMPEIELPAISGGVWACESVASSPSVVLAYWTVYEVKMSHSDVRTRHFIGYNSRLREGRASSAIKSFDPETMRGVTESGRVYELRGKPGYNSDAAYTWERWKQYSKATDVVDVTKELLR